MLRIESVSTPRTPRTSPRDLDRRRPVGTLNRGAHRSTVVHAFGGLRNGALGITEHDRILPIVPMFHANAWGMPYEGWFTGSDFVMPGKFLQAQPLCKMIAQEKVTFAGARIVAPQHQDICCLDVFRAAVAQARNPRLPAEQCQWWYWSKRRKQPGKKVEK